ncbi:MAG TPA: helix-turn-helix transcriptional regulator [Micromonosporaceae bacterium]|nr:helix-turn-helix transcriptional regulator [Micromonosporaceae bacterium]
MMLLRRVIGDALRARRQAQHRTLREVSTAANVSLGYLSEVERGQKEASSELLAAICEALGAQQSEVLREVSDTLALAEQMPDVLTPGVLTPAGEDGAAVVPATPVTRSGDADAQVSVTVHRETPLKTTLRAHRTLRSDDLRREVVRVA